MTTVVRLLRRFWHFVRPLPNWRERVRTFKSGRIAWPIAGMPPHMMIGPWPPEWTVHRLVTGEDGSLSVEYLDAVSDVSGCEALGEDAVRCARCGIALHVKETSMTTNLDVPSCTWCRDLVA